MAYKGQHLTELEKIKYRIAANEWKNSEAGILYYKNFKNKKVEKIENYNKTPKLCKYCNSPITYNKRKLDFCSRSCSAKQNNLNRKSNGYKQDYTILKEKYKNNLIIKPTVVKTGIYKKCKMCEKQFYVSKCNINKKIYCSRNCLFSDPNKKGGKGGYRKGSGVGKHGWYKGYWCDSSYELAFVIYNLDHNINFSRNKQGFEYEWEGEKHLYYPDFMIDDTFIEIKGFWTNQHDAKIKSFPHKLKVYFKSDLKSILEYVVTKYGKDYIKLYESNPYKDKKDNICKECGKPCKTVFCDRKCSAIYRWKNRSQGDLNPDYKIENLVS